MKNYRNKEISWLSFNDRVLQEAQNKLVPLIERIKFLGIYSNNLDEFFRVRVAILKRLSLVDKKSDLEGGKPGDILKEIHKIVLRQNVKFDKVYLDIIKDLEKEGVFLINELELDAIQGAFVTKYFEKKVRPKLMPVIVAKNRELPDLKDDAIYLAVSLIKRNPDKTTYALVEVPTGHCNRFFILPSSGKENYIILLEDVIRYELRDLFFMYDFDEISAYTVKLTRDAELDLDDDISQSFMRKIARGLEKRKEAHPVRFVHDKEIPLEFLNLLLRKLHFSEDAAVIEGGRYHNFKDFISFPKLGKKHLTYPPMPPISHPDLKRGHPVFSVLRGKDILLHFPFHPFSHFIDFLREASIDPQVKGISITVYRLAKNSNVINALINAARNGKNVVVVMELQARFDEQANIKWANQLRDEGVKVIFGVQGLKVHTKLCCITRKEHDGVIGYACIGTGNFNEDSAGIFSDHLYMTSNKGIVSEVIGLFDFFDKNYRIPKFSHLLVAPFYLRDKLEDLIKNEMQLAKENKPAFLYFKANNLVDSNIIQLLYKAKSSGVDIKLNIRGMFSLMPEFDKDQEPIASIGIIDRFLEHTRLYVFGNNGDPIIYFSSGDLMTRNLDRRIEVACPVYDPKLRKELFKMLELQWNDNCSARILDNCLTNKRKESNGEDPIIRSQIDFYKYLVQNN